MGGEVEVEVEEIGIERKEDSTCDKVPVSVKRGCGFEFLEEIPEDEKEKELEEKRMKEERGREEVKE
jgi:hypothetical protein